MRPFIAFLFLVFLMALAKRPSYAFQTEDGRRPWIGAVYFYWYEWDYEKKLGNWMGGVHNTPLFGYYDSRSFEDNYRSLWLASEWGFTDLFLDYWGAPWKGEGEEPRERTVLRAAEALRQKGYPIHIAYYQDGTNFEMKDFSKNITEKRDTYRWLELYARSPAWCWLNGKPFQMVYARNGTPVPSQDHEGFRTWLRSRYKDISILNSSWGTNFGSFDEIDMDFNALGYQRAYSIRYQYELWKREWGKMEDRIREELGLPGLIASLDVGYGPFLGFGYAEYVKAFGGPHSYAGIFGQPFEMDEERFIQSVLAKRYGGVFFDHLKNCYHDWNIRIPGTAYLPDPFVYHRFWIGNLMRYSEGVLHMSWNEWWEGSNAEPTMEWGKRFCEENLFYSTIMQLCFDSIRDWNKDAEVAIVLNDWIFESGLGDPRDLYEPLQALRKLNVKFDIIPSDDLSSEELRRKRVLIAPSGLCGFGENRNGERIADLILGWVSERKDAKLIATIGEDIWDGIEGKWIRKKLDGKPQPGGDINLFVDLGTEGDEEILVRGYSGREDWGEVETDRGRERMTVRWTPATGRETLLFLPASPYRDHVLRIAGNAIWPNRAFISIGSRELGSFEIHPGYSIYEVHIPSDFIGPSRGIEIRVLYERSNVPGRISPDRYRGERRVCNLAINWIQFSTSNVPAGERRRMGISKMPERRSIQWPLEGGKTISSYDDGIAREILCGPEDRILLVNGRFGGDERWWGNLLKDWAEIDVPRYVRGEGLMGSILDAGDTRIVLIENRDISGEKDLICSIPSYDLPLSEAIALSRDGSYMEPVSVEVDDKGNYILRDKVRYYAVYELAFSPVRCDLPEIVLHPGETSTIRMRLRNMVEERISGEVSLESVIPSIGSKPVQVEIAPSQDLEIEIPVTAATYADWGNKTVLIRLSFNGRNSYLIRRILVEAKGEGKTGEKAVLGKKMKTGGNPIKVDARELGTGKGVLTVETDEIRAILDESMGGTVKELVSKGSGRNYGAGSFGISYGRFSRYDPKKPAVTTSDFVVDEMIRQSDGSAIVELVSLEPERAVIRASYEDERVWARQTYTFYSAGRYFRIDVEVRPKDLKGIEELVVFDARLLANKLWKSFPNFVGIEGDEERIHHGWRMGPWVPPYFTLMNPPSFDEGISLILRDVSGVGMVRQGFWGKKRPEKGPREYAWIELVSTDKGGSRLTCWVLFHSGHQVVAEEFDPPEKGGSTMAKQEGVRWLNNLVAELLDVTPVDNPSQKEWSFTNPREGWVFIASTAKVKGSEKLWITIDKAPKEQAVIVHQATPSDDPSYEEAMCYLSAGEHTVGFWKEGQPTVERIIVRAIPELIFCKFQYNPHISPHGPYDWAFLKRHVLPHVNTIVGSGAEEHRPFVEEWKEEGKRWIVEVYAAPFFQDMTADEAYRYWTENVGFQNPLYDGVIVDEFFGGERPRYRAIIEAIRQIHRNERFQGKVFYPYCTSMYGAKSSEEFIKTVMDAGYRFAWERYLQEQSTETMAKTHLMDALGQEMQKWRKALPDCVGHMIVCFGYMSMITTESLNVNPQADFKAWLDMQFQYIATDPAFFGLYGIMAYTSGYADEETVRWAAKLYRHYGIEGKREKLSELYGFKYRLDHLENPDFEEGLRGWTVEAAEEGSVEAKNVEGYGWLQGRYPRTKLGDSFLWMKRSSKKPNKVSQEIKNMQPGKLYSLKMVTSDYNDLMEGRSFERKHVISIQLDGVELLPEKCFQFAVANNYAHHWGSFNDKHKFWMNYHHYVFRAKGRTAKLTISDWTSEREPIPPIDQELMVNFVEVQPYLEE